MLRLCNELRPDVVLMDVRMPGVDGIEATREIVTASADQRPQVLILTTFDLDEHVYDALRAGASGFLLKDVTAEHLFDAVRIVAGRRPARPDGHASTDYGVRPHAQPPRICRRRTGPTHPTRD